MEDLLAVRKEAQNVNPLVLKNGIFVAGHPRSGTSLACKLLESAGVSFSSDTKADKYNKDGYFELLSAKELEKNLIEQAMTPENIRELNKIVSLLNKTSGLSGLKIVHIPSVFFYHHIARNMRVVFIFRHPAEVKASMYKRGISQFKLSWFDNNNALIAAHENIPKSIVISYESLISGKPHIRKGFSKLGFKVDMEVIKKNYQTQKSSSILLTIEEQRMYKFLKKLEMKSCI